MIKDKVMFLLPILVFVFLGVFFSYKWWSAKNRLSPTPIPQNEGIEIEEAGRSLLQSIGVTEERSVQLIDVENSGLLGVVNWSENKKSLTILATLPDDRSALYQAWMKKPDGTLKKLGTLKKEKAGYLLDVSFSSPLEGMITISVSRETKNDSLLERKLLEGIISF